jgi:hypothetical protein
VRHNRAIKNYAPSENAIVVKGLTKSFKRLKVLDGIDFVVKHGTVLALPSPFIYLSSFQSTINSFKGGGGPDEKSIPNASFANLRNFMAQG